MIVRYFLAKILNKLMQGFLQKLTSEVPGVEIRAQSFG
jgi:hypothetical protein